MINEVDLGKFIYSCNSQGVYYSPKHYNGVTKPTKNRIMLLGNPINIDITM